MELTAARWRGTSNQLPSTSVSPLETQRGRAGCTRTVATQGGFETLTRAQAKELGPFKVPVNTVDAGLIRIRFLEYLNSLEPLERVRQSVPSARIGPPEEVENVVAFIASEEPSYITGEIIAVKGGLKMD